MKKFSLVLLYLLLTSNTFADIKYSRLECTQRFNSDKSRFWHTFLIFNPTTQGIVTMYAAHSKFKYTKKVYKVRTTPKFIYLEKHLELRRDINRETGYLSGGPIGTEGWCSKMPDNFDPEKFLQEAISKNLKEQKSKNKF